MKEKLAVMCQAEASAKLEVSKACIFLARLGYYLASVCLSPRVFKHLASAMMLLDMDA